MGLPMPGADALAKRKYANVERIALSTTTAKTAAMAAQQLHFVTADVAWHFNHGPRASVTATTSHFLVQPGVIVEVWPEDTNWDGVAGILDQGSGYLYVLKAD